MTTAAVPMNSVVEPSTGMLIESFFFGVFSVMGQYDKGSRTIPSWARTSGFGYLMCFSILKFTM